MKKVYYQLKMYQKSPLRVSSGDNEFTDSDLMLDGRGCPFIPGSSVAGVLRELCRTRIPSLSDKDIRTLFGYIEDGKIVKADVSIAKNYLSINEMQELNEIVTMYLDYATRQARRHIPMTMADWASKLDAFLQFNDAEVLQNKGKVTAAIAKSFAESEFEQYRVIQDRLYQSDFDRLVASIEEKNN